MQHLRDPVICKHGELVDVMKGAVAGAVAGAVEAGPDVCGEDLSAFVDVDLAVFEGVDVAETGEVAYEEVDESGCGLVGGGDAV